MKKIIITGANGVGKSHFARQLGLARPTVPVMSFDAIKLRTNWQQRSRAEIDIELSRLLKTETWILEGGPSLLHQAVGLADALVWLDPPEHIRAWRLVTRPWKNFGMTRPELPSGNVDWPWQQYRFGVRSLMNRTKFRSYISDVFYGADQLEKWRCSDEEDRIRVIKTWSEASD